MLFREGETSDKMYVVKSGFVRLTKTIFNEEVTVEELGAGDFCGELALVNAQPRQVSAQAITDCQLIPIEAAKFEEMLRHNPEVAIRMFKKICHRLTQAHYRISNLVLRSNQGRLLHQLRHEVRVHAEAKGQSVHHPIPLPDNLAEALALEIGEIKELLNQFVRDDLISLERNGNFQILDIRAYERYLSFLELQTRFAYRAD